VFLEAFVFPGVQHGHEKVSEKVMTPESSQVMDGPSLLLLTRAGTVARGGFKLSEWATWGILALELWLSLFSDKRPSIACGSGAK
jgi:hypothetical protein